MTTSNGPLPRQLPPRQPLRLRMSARRGLGTLDGGWWPRSRDLAKELGDLVDQFPREQGRIVRALLSPPDWDAAPGEARVRERLTVGSLPRDDTHLVVLTTSDRTTLRVLVAPSELSPDQGAEALLAASSRGYTHSAGSLLEEVTATPDVDPRNHWSV